MRNNYVGWLIGLLIGLVALCWAMYIKHKREKMRWKYYGYTDKKRDEQRIAQLNGNINQAKTNLENLDKMIANEKRINEELYEWNRTMGIEAGRHN